MPLDASYPRARASRGNAHTSARFRAGVTNRDSFLMIFEVRIPARREWGWELVRVEAVHVAAEKTSGWCSCAPRGHLRQRCAGVMPLRRERGEQGGEDSGVPTRVNWLSKDAFDLGLPNVLIDFARKLNDRRWRGTECKEGEGNESGVIIHSEDSSQVADSAEMPSRVCRRGAFGTVADDPRGWMGCLRRRQGKSDVDTKKKMLWKPHQRSNRRRLV